MDRIRFRDLQRWRASDIVSALPLAVTHDSQAIMVLLTIKTYNALARNYAPSHDSQARLPVYNASIHKTGDKVLIRQGKQLVEAIVPELDADGQPVWAIS